MTKKEIIGIVDGAIKSQIDTSVFKGDNQNKPGIGSNQFREFANICLRAECYEEVELQVMYNKAKDYPNDKKNPQKRGNSWDKLMLNKKDTLADIVISCMRKVRENSSEEDCLKNLSLMFGYFYWNARIYAAENKNKK